MPRDPTFLNPPPQRARVEADPPQAGKGLIPRNLLVLLVIRDYVCMKMAIFCGAPSVSDIPMVPGCQDEIVLDWWLVATEPIVPIFCVLHPNCV